MRGTKIAALVIVMCGLLVLGKGLWQILAAEKQEKAAYQAAKALVKRDKKMQVNDDFKPETGEASGLLSIPKISAELPIVEGTDPDDLEKGVGHYKGSFYPQQNGQIVLSGHRDTVFRRAGELKIGDQLIVQMPYGKFAYEIIKTKIVTAEDTSIITLQNNEEELVLTTCYPFSYLGNAPDRYIIYAKRTTDKD